MGGEQEEGLLGGNNWLTPGKGLWRRGRAGGV